MSRYVIFILFYSWFTLNLLGQVYETNPNLLKTNWWFVGNGALFSFDTIQKNKDAKFNAYEGCSSISFKDGNLRAYSDGVSLVIMDSLIPINLYGYYSSHQGVLFHDLNDEEFIITTTNPSKGVYQYRFNNFNLIEMKKLLNSTDEAQCASMAQNNRNFNLFFHDGNDFIFTFLIKDDELICCPKINPLHTRTSNTSNTSGVVKFIPDKSIIISLNTFSFNASLHLFNENTFSFDSLSKLDISLPFGFDYQSNFFYFLESANKIWQFHITSFIPLEYKRKLIYETNQPTIGFLQTGLDGNIYFANYNSDSIGLIKPPTTDSIYPIIIKNGKSLNGKTCNFGLPNFNASYFHTPSVDFAYTEDCWGHQYEFEGRDTLKATEWKWIFTKNSFRDSVATKHCNYAFPDTGKWLVSHIAITATRQDTITKTLTILPKFEHNFLGRDTFYCQGETINLTLRVPSDMHCVHWNNEEPNLDEELGAIIDYHHFHSDTLHIDTAGIYTVRITNKTFCQAWDTFRVIEAPLPTKPLISYETGALASTVIAKTYRWFLNGSFLLETEERSYKPISKGYYQLQLFSEYNCPSPLSDSFLVDTLISIEKIEKEELFSIYPNPSDGNITIKAMQNIDYQVEVYDMLGKLILQKLNAKSIFIDQKGSYVVKITTESGVWSRVVMVE